MSFLSPQEQEADVIGSWYGLNYKF